MIRLRGATASCSELRESTHHTLCFNSSLLRCTSSAVRHARRRGRGCGGSRSRAASGREITRRRRTSRPVVSYCCCLSPRLPGVAFSRSLTSLRALHCCLATAWMCAAAARLHRAKRSAAGQATRQPPRLRQHQACLMSECAKQEEGRRDWSKDRAMLDSTRLQWPGLRSQSWIGNSEGRASCARETNRA